MNREAAAAFLNLIELSIRMTPVFLCLKPKHGQYENIAAMAVYIWVIMIAVQALFHIPEDAFVIFQGVFGAIFFIVLMIFFEGSTLLKTFLYLSAWLFAGLLTSVDAFLGWFLRRQSVLSYEHICLIIDVIMLVLYIAFINSYLKERVLKLFDHMSLRDSAFLLAVPSLFLVMLLFGSRTIFQTEILLSGMMPSLVFYMAICAMMLILYILIIEDRYRLIERKKSEEQLEMARRIIDLQKENYDNLQGYQQQVRIIRHDFRHHIHALLHMNEDEKQTYLINLQDEMDRPAELTFCENPAVNGLLQEYAARSRAEDISFEAQIAFGEELPVDDLTLCVIIGNLLQNALEANGKCADDRFIRLYVKSEGAALRIMVENRYDGNLKREDDRLLSTKKDGGLGMISIRRLLEDPKDDFDYYDKGDTFTAMVYLSPRKKQGQPV